MKDVQYSVFTEEDVKNMQNRAVGSLGGPRPAGSRRPVRTAGAALGVALLIGLGGCSKTTWKQIGDDSREALETTGEVIEGATKGAIKAVEGVGNTPAKRP